jgi:hypothetical protein
VSPMMAINKLSMTKEMIKVVIKKIIQTMVWSGPLVNLSV